MAEAALVLEENHPENRTPSGRFAPGTSGNPGGRPKGLAAQIREVVPADRLAEYYRAIWALDKRALRKLKIDPADVTLADRNKAGEWLADRGYGKAPAHAPVEGGDPLERDATDAAIDSTVDELAARRETQAAGEVASGAVAAQRPD